CALPVDRAGQVDAALLETSACPLCSGRDELLLRGPHEHHCGFCDATWRHKGRCALEPAASCPWCMPVPKEPSTLLASRGTHLHACPACRSRWRHDEICVAPTVSEFVRCPVCEGRRRRTQLTRAALAAAVAGAVLLPIAGSFVLSPRSLQRLAERAP